MLQYIITTVLCYSAIYESNELMSEKNVIWRWEREADSVEKHFSSSLFDWDSTFFFSD